MTGKRLQGSTQAGHRVAEGFFQQMGSKTFRIKLLPVGLKQDEQADKDCKSQAVPEDGT